MLWPSALDRHSQKAIFLTFPYTSTLYTQFYASVFFFRTVRNQTVRGHNCGHCKILFSSLFMQLSVLNVSPLFLSLLAPNTTFTRPTPTTPSCPGDKVYTTCGSACPTTCSNFRNPPVCITLCVSGCFCPSGTVEFGDSNRCVAPDTCQDVCELPPSPGPCRAAFRRYFYNSTSEQCEQFIYGGCRGNANNFETQESCIAGCTCKWSPVTRDRHSHKYTATYV